MSADPHHASTRSLSRFRWLRSAAAFSMAALFALGASLPAGAEAGQLRQPESHAADLSPEELGSITVPAPDRAMPFEDGERLVYALGWGMFSVAHAELTTERVEFNGQPAWRFTLNVRTNRFADAFYKVRNQTTAWLDDNLLRTIAVVNFQNEGERHREVTVTFDYGAKTARYHNRLSEDEWAPVGILPETLDPMGITFYVRSLPLEPGELLVIPTTNGKEFFLTYVNVVGKQKRKFRFGTEEAWLLEPDVKDVGGVFERSEGARIRFWFSADHRRLPLRMESEVSVGSFWAELVRVEKVETAP